jgi:hypothetical protein
MSIKFQFCKTDIHGEIMIQPRKASKIKLQIPVILLLALVLAACASLENDDKKMPETLKASVETFNSDVKWEDYSAALAFVPADKKEQFWAVMDRLKGKIRIIEFQIREVDNPDKKQDKKEHKQSSGNATLTCQYWRTDSPILQTVCICQKWYYIEKEKIWKVQESGLGVLVKTKAEQ